MNSLLYGISHLSPHCKGSGASTCEAKEEEDDICTPLAKRVYKRFMSRHVVGRRKGMTSKSGRSVASDSLGEQEDNLRLRLEDRDLFSLRGGERE